MTAALAVAYAWVPKWRGEKEYAETDAMFRTLPPPPCRRNCSTAARFE